MKNYYSKENAIEFDNVYKSFSNLEVLSNLNLNVPLNSVYAFLGNNGEGKSTTIRLITGLSKVDSGNVRVLGKDINKFNRDILKDIGCLVDSPSLYPNLTANEFLRIGCILKSLPLSDISKVLSLVNLQENNKLLVGDYSLGMKQRLAIAHSLLGSPKLLILDEPTNGLDPEGISEIRKLISILPETANCTVFFSSHNLSEVEKIATHFGVLKEGKIRFESGMSDWLVNQENNVVMELSDVKQASSILTAHGVKSKIVGKRKLCIRGLKADEQSHLHNLLMKAGIELFQSYYERISLEQWFISESNQGAYE